MQQGCWSLGVLRRQLLIDTSHGKAKKYLGRDSSTARQEGRGLQQGLWSDASAAQGGEGQLGGGPCIPSLLVDLGQQQDKGHGQGTVVEAVNIGVIPFLWRRMSQPEASTPSLD